MNAVTYSPYTKAYYKGSLQSVDFKRDSDLELLAYVNESKQFGEGRLNFEAEVIRRAERHQRDAVTDSNEVSNITTTMMLDMVIGSMWKGFNALAAVTRIPVPKLQLDVPFRNAKSAARKKVGELQPANVTNTEFSKATFALFKNVVPIYVSDEARFKALIDPLSYDIQQAAGALGAAENEQIATEIETATTAAKASWSDETSGVSDNNPLDDVTDEFVTISDNHYRPSILCMHPKVASSYLSNTWINGTATPATDRQVLGVYPLPKFPGITAVVDSDFTDGSATLLDPSVMLFGEGPVVAEQYRDYDLGADAYITRKWIEPLLVTSDGARELTSL